MLTVPGQPHRAELTRVGTFVLNDNGVLSDERGGELFPRIRMPGELSTVVINAWGDVIAITRGGECRIVSIIRLASDAVAATGTASGPGRVLVDRGAMQAAEGLPGEGKLGLVLQGAVEVPPGHDAGELGPRFSAGATGGTGLGASIRLTSSGMEHFAKFLRHARRRRESRMDLQLARSQAAQLLNALTPGPALTIDPGLGGEGNELTKTLAARRMNAPKIADLHRYGRRFTPERFDIGVAAGVTNGGRTFPGQELQVAQARASKGFRAGA